jgi:hypothetical protein
VRTGHRFLLADEPEREWLEWEPLVAIGSDMLPPGATLPDCRRAKLAWRGGLIFRGSRSVQGWIVALDSGLLGPEDLLQPSEEAREGGALLEVAGNEVPLPESAVRHGGGVAIVAAERPADIGVWPSNRIRRPERAEDCLAVADPNAPPLPLAASRLTPTADGWKIDAAVPIDEGWHGAPVLARSDGHLVGLLLLAEGDARVSWIPGG